MPIPVKFVQKNIALNDKTQALLKLLKEVSDLNEIDDTILRSDITTHQTGLWGSFLFILEKVTNRLQNYTSSILPTLDKELDASANVLYKHYRHYLNTVIKSMSRSAKGTQKTTVSDHFILLREILLRTAVICLSVKINDADNGLKVIKFLEDFVSRINEDEILLEGWFDKKKLTNFGIQLATIHGNWIQVFKTMVIDIKNIHLPITSISQILSLLARQQITIARHILLRSDHKIKPLALSEDWVMTTMIEFEEQHSQNMQLLLSAKDAEDSGIKEKLAMTVFDSIGQTLFQIETLNSLKAHENIQTITKLYQLFNRTNLLFNIAIQIEKIILIGGWVPILSGMIKLGRLGDILEVHVKDCDTYLAISRDELSKHSSDSRYQQLVKFGSPTLSVQLPTLINNLALLKSPAVRQGIFNIIKDSVSGLQYLSSKLEPILGPEKNNLIDINPKEFFNYSNFIVEDVKPILSNIDFGNNSEKNENPSIIKHTIYEAEYPAPIQLQQLKFDRKVDIFCLIGIERALVIAKLKKALSSGNAYILNILKNQLASFAVKDNDNVLPASIRQQKIYVKLREEYFKNKRDILMYLRKINDDFQGKKPDNLEKPDKDILPSDIFSLFVLLNDNNVNASKTYKNFTESHIKLIKYFSNIEILKIFLDDNYLVYSKQSGYGKLNISKNEAIVILKIISALENCDFYLWQVSSDNKLEQCNGKSDSNDNNNNNRYIIHLLYNNQEQSLSRLRVLDPNDRALLAKFDDERRQLIKFPSRSIQYSSTPLEESKLIDCVSNNKIENVIIFIRKGININITDSRGHSLISIAIRKGFDDMLILLLRNGALPNHRIGGNNKLNYKGWTPLCMAIANFKKHREDIQINMIRALLENGAQIDHCIGEGSNLIGGSWEGWTPFTLAVHNWEKRSKCPATIVSFLLQYGAKPGHSIEADNWDNFTPLQLNKSNRWNTEENSNAILKLLISNQDSDLIKFKPLPLIWENKEPNREQISDSDMPENKDISSEEYESPIKLTESDRYTFFKKIEQYQGTANHEAAKADLKILKADNKKRDKDKRDPKVYFLLGKTNAALGNSGAAIKELGRALRYGYDQKIVTETIKDVLSPK